MKVQPDIMRERGNDTYVLMPPNGGWGGHTRMFAEAWRNAGGKCVLDTKTLIRLPHVLSTVVSRLLAWSFWRHNDRLLLPASWRIDSCAWPWCWKYEIIPMMWDLWPQYMPSFIRFLKLNRVRLVFCTQRQNIEIIKRFCPKVKAIWIPEGIDKSLYPQGPALEERAIDVFHYGREVPAATKLRTCPQLQSFNLRLDTRGGLGTEEMRAALRDAKLTVCFPRCDTKPEQALGIETLTQRYWECMLSGTLIIGRAPQELIDLCGYNPVIELKDNPCAIVSEVLSDIGKYQWLADKNRQTANEIADWSNRMPTIFEAVRQLDA